MSFYPAWFTFSWHNSQVLAVLCMYEHGKSFPHFAHRNLLGVAKCSSCLRDYFHLVSASFESVPQALLVSDSTWDTLEWQTSMAFILHCKWRYPEIQPCLWIYTGIYDWSPAVTRDSSTWMWGLMAYRTLSIYHNFSSLNYTNMWD